MANLSVYRNQTALNFSATADGRWLEQLVSTEDIRTVCTRKLEELDDPREWLSESEWLVLSQGIDSDVPSIYELHSRITRVIKRLKQIPEEIGKAKKEKGELERIGRVIREYWKKMADERYVVAEKRYEVLETRAARCRELDERIQSNLRCARDLRDAICSFLESYGGVVLSQGSVGIATHIRLRYLPADGLLRQSGVFRFECTPDGTWSYVADYKDLDYFLRLRNLNPEPGLPRLSDYGHLVKLPVIKLNDGTWVFATRKTTFKTRKSDGEKTEFGVEITYSEHKLGCVVYERCYKARETPKRLSEEAARLQWHLELFKSVKKEYSELPSEFTKASDSSGSANLMEANFRIDRHIKMLEHEKQVLEEERESLSEAYPEFTYNPDNIFNYYKEVCEYLEKLEIYSKRDLPDTFALTAGKHWLTMFSVKQLVFLECFIRANNGYLVKDEDQIEIELKFAGTPYVNYRLESLGNIVDKSLYYPDTSEVETTLKIEYRTPYKIDDDDNYEYDNWCEDYASCNLGERLLTWSDEFKTPKITNEYFRNRFIIESHQLLEEWTDLRGKHRKVNLRVLFDLLELCLCNGLLEFEGDEVIWLDEYYFYRQKFEVALTQMLEEGKREGRTEIKTFLAGLERKAKAREQGIEETELKTTPRDDVLQWLERNQPSELSMDVFKFEASRYSTTFTNAELSGMLQDAGYAKRRVDRGGKKVSLWLRTRPSGILDATITT